MGLKEPNIECRSCKKLYPRKVFRCPSCKEPGITKLYKYVSYNENSLSILINKEVWFPKTKILNDPFEFQFHLSENQINGFPIDQNAIRQAVEDSKELGVFCLTEVNDNILMWSHYANQHKGFCIEFERSDHNYLGGEACVPVFYPEDDQLPIYKPFDVIRPESFAGIATTKAKLWSYELEWRMISREKGNRPYALPGDITAIIFGERMDKKHRQTIKNILGSEMLYLEAIKMKGRFRLKITPVNF